MERILVMDVGNTNIALGVFEGKVLKHHWKVTTSRERTPDEYGILLKGLFRDKGVDAGSFAGVVIGSVVPPLMHTLDVMCKTYFGCSPLVVGPGIRTGLPIKYDDPRDVGADRIAGAVAAVQLYGPPLMVIDLGTATTFTVVDADGQYIGGVIAPGVSISTEALFQRTAKLPRIDVVRAKRVLGRSTITSIQAGVYFGFIGQVDGIAERICEEIQLPFQIVATGGMAELISSDSRMIQHTHPNLTLEGLRILWERNR